MKSDDRRLKILETVVDEYIRTGEPVGSKTIATMFGNSVSSATIRNDMATLEKLGFLEQPHASAGRVPTYLGYRMYISNLMHPREPVSYTHLDVYKRQTARRQPARSTTSCCGS